MWTSASCRRQRKRNAGAKWLGLRESGLTFAAITAQTGLTKNGVSGICRRHAERGLASGPRGPAPGTGRFLWAQQEAEVQALTLPAPADALGLP